MTASGTVCGSPGKHMSCSTLPGTSVTAGLGLLAAGWGWGSCFTTGLLSCSAPCVWALKAGEALPRTVLCRRSLATGSGLAGKRPSPARIAQANQLNFADRINRHENIQPPAKNTGVGNPRQPKPQAAPTDLSASRWHDTCPLPHLGLAFNSPVLLQNDLSALWQHGTEAAGTCWEHEQRDVRRRFFTPQPGRVDNRRHGNTRETDVAAPEIDSVGWW